MELKQVSENMIGAAVFGAAWRKYNITAESGHGAVDVISRVEREIGIDITPSTCCKEEYNVKMKSLFTKTVFSISKNFDLRN